MVLPRFTSLPLRTALSRVLTGGMLVAALGAAPSFAGAPLSGLAFVAGASPQEILQRLRAEEANIDGLLKARADQATRLDAIRRDRDAAAGRVDAMKRNGERGTALEKSLRQALVLDENYTLAQSQLAAIDGELAREGAQLLRLYDALLLEKNKDARKYKAKDPRRTSALKAYQALATRRDQIRGALSPVLQPAQPMGAQMQAPSMSVELEARPDDDIESLMEKADLARDLETRFLRRAEAVRKRIRQLESERSLARDVLGVASTDALFDESDHRVLISRGGVRAGVGLANPIATSNNLLAFSGNPAAPSSFEQNDQGVVVVAEPESPPPDPVSNGSESPDAPPTEVDSFESGFGTDGTRNDGDTDDVSAPPMALPSLPMGITERAFNGGTSERDLAALMASDALTLPQLRALERELAKEASRLKQRSKSLRKEVKSRARRR